VSLTPFLSAISLSLAFPFACTRRLTDSTSLPSFFSWISSHLIPPQNKLRVIQLYLASFSSLSLRLLQLTLHHVHLPSSPHSLLSDSFHTHSQQQAHYQLIQLSHRHFPNPESIPIITLLPKSTTLRNLLQPTSLPSLEDCNVKVPLTFTKGHSSSPPPLLWSHPRLQSSTSIKYQTNIYIISPQSVSCGRLFWTRVSLSS